MSDMNGISVCYDKESKHLEIDGVTVENAMRILLFFSREAQKTVQDTSLFRPPTIQTIERSGSIAPSVNEFLVLKRDNQDQGTGWSSTEDYSVRWC